MQVEDHYTQDDREGDQDHGEHDVVDNNWNAKGGLRHPVGQQQHEDSQSDEHRNGESHLLSCRQQERTGELIMTAIFCFKLKRQILKHDCSLWSNVYVAY